MLLNEVENECQRERLFRKITWTVTDLVCRSMWISVLVRSVQTEQTCRKEHVGRKGIFTYVLVMISSYHTLITQL